MWDDYPNMGGDMDYLNKKPLKIWDSSRRIRKGVAVGSFEELVVRGREKLSIPPSEPVVFVLETDGTQVDDGDYLKCLPINAVLMVLRHGEYWTPPRMDLIRAVSTIPRIVCETIHALHLEDEIPSWKIMDNKGRVTVVLHWDHGRGMYQRRLHMHMRRNPPPPPPPKRHPVYVPTRSERSGTIITSSGKKETLINDIYPPPPKYSNSPQITVINHDEVRKVASSFHPHRMPRPAGTLDSTIHIHTLECAANVHEPAARAASPDNGSVECDFHCCSLHEEGRAIVVQKSVATSPIQDPHLRTSPQPSALSDGKKSGVKQQVRFLDVKEGTTVRPGQSNDSSDSDTENTGEEDTVTTDKYLLLVDQLTSDRKDHLSIKDIGVILERLSSTILDVERLNREKDPEGCHNWTIKATIRGFDLNDLGLIYNGYYFVVSEHPEYRKGNKKNGRNSQEEEEEDERILIRC